LTSRTGDVEALAGLLPSVANAGLSLYREKGGNVNSTISALQQALNSELKKPVLKSGSGSKSVKYNPYKTYQNPGLKGSINQLLNAFQGFSGWGGGAAGTRKVTTSNSRKTKIF
jgi:hypothetical protein